MKQPLTPLYKLLLLALALGTGFTSRAQTYTPVALTGFTEDIIANGTGPVSGSTTADIDGSAATGGTGYTLMAQDYVGPTGQVPNNTAYPALEASGLITSALNSAITYQLASYSANNALRLFGANASGTLSFATPRAAAELYVIGTSGNAASVLDISVNFSDGTTQLFTGQTIADWFAASQPNVVRELLGRVSRGNNAVQYTGSPVGPRFYQLRLVLDAANVTKTITGLTFTKPLAAGTPVLLAVTAGTFPVCAATPTGLTAAATTTSGGITALATACSSTNIYLSIGGLANQVGYTYQWQASTNGTTFTNISGATGSTYTATGQTAATSYRAVVTCLYGGTAANSAPVQIAQSAFDACYCTPSASLGCGTYAQLLKVEITGTTLVNTTTCAASPYYTNYPVAATTTATLNPGASYPLSITLGRYAKAGLWIDYDHSGTFDASEYLAIGSNATNTSGSTATLTPTLVIPATALSGATRMRVRTQYFPTSSALDGTSACISTTYGETEDYTITIAPSTACTGTPPAITLAASVATTCAGSPITLTASGVMAGTSGLSYQFQSSPAGTSTFTNLGMAQALPVYTVASQTTATDYRVIVTCTASTQSSTSALVAVAQNAFLTCYCTPTYANGGANDNVARVQLGTLDNATTGNASPYYRDYSAQQTGAGATLPTPDIFPGTNAVVTLTFGSDSNQHGAVWIDFNQNGILGDVANEFVATTASAGSNGTVALTLPVPAGAVLGLTKMRVRGGDDTNDPTLGQACGASGSSYGEAEDYLVNVVAPVPCTGTPPAVTATASTVSVCANATGGFTLGLTGIVPGTTGLSYDFQSSPAGTNTFTSLGTAQTTPTYSVATQTASTDYRVVVTCTASGQTSTSSIISVATSYLNCYCAAVSGGANEYIKSVTFPGTPGFTNATNANSTGGYGDFTTDATLTTTLNQGATYVNGVSVIVRSNNTNSQGGMWIDYDHSGTFDASEYVLIGTSSAIATDVTFPVTLVVPATALLGQTRVRVRWRNGGFTAADACVSGATTWYGETEDYFITIAAPTTCSAPPATVVASADVTTACANASFTLSTNSIPATLGGYTYQWQSRVGTAAFADITGATTNPYTIASQSVAADYRLVVSCQFGGTPVTSNTIAVGQNAFSDCYCTASSTNVCSNYGVITSVVLGSINNPTGCTSTNSYSSYTSPTTPTTTTNLTPGTTATLTLGVANATATLNYHYAVWIDFNHNGTFDASEFVANSTATVSANTATISIPVPAVSSSVLLGPTRMRIRTNAGQYGAFTAAGACGAVYNGETEDYIINLAPCTPTTATFSYGTTTAYCVSGTTNPTVTLATGATAGTYSVAPATGLTLNATTGAITLSSSTAGTYTVTNTVPATATGCSSTATTSVTINAAPTAGFSYPTATRCAGTATTVTPALATGATAGTYSLPTATGLSVNTTTGVVTVGATATAGTYTVTNTVAAANGCAATTSTATFIISAPTTATFSYAGSPYCISGTTNPVPTITGTAGGAFTVAPATGLTLNATTGAITLSSSTAGTYTVTYTVSGACGSSSTQQVVINPAVTASFTYPTPTLGAACAGGTGTFTPTMGTGATLGTFAATPAGLGLNATTGVINLATSAAGTYTITNSVTGTCAATGTAPFTVNAAPATPTLTTTGTPATGITLTSSATTGNQFYLNGAPVSGATGTSYIINSGTRNGSYTVVVTSAAGCASAASAAVSVTVTGTSSAQAGTSLTLYPNPTHDGLLTLALSGYRETVALSITNALGQRVYESTVVGGALTQQQSLDLSALPSGLYLLQARTASGSVDVRRIVRE